MIAEIPVLEVGPLPSADLCRHDPEAVHRLMNAALSGRSHRLLPFVTRLCDRISLSWLLRQADPYLEEIRHVATLIKRPGAYFLNTIYEWACSTSVAADPGGDGARMIRVLDWGLAGLGRHVVIARQETAHGPFYNATWPGYAGVHTAMAPGRFSAAINQAPRVPVFGIDALDRMVTRLRVLRSRDTVLASHLLRRVFEDAPDYRSAVAMLSDPSVALAMPALFVLAGTEADQGCVVEGLGRERRVHRIADADPLALGIANQWLSPDLRGSARNEAVPTGLRVPAETNNRARQATIVGLQKRASVGAEDLPEPVLNSLTVMVVAANARRGEMTVEALDRAGESIIPRVVARRALRHLAA